MIALESLDPVRVAGFWIPEMISIAGGEDVAGDPGLNPAEVGWGELESLGADVVIVMPDGSLEDAHAQAMEHWEQIDALGAERVFAVDAAAAFAEPGPRLVDGVELLAPPAPPRADRPAGQRRTSRAAAPVLRLPRALTQATAIAPTTETIADQRHRGELHRDPAGGPSMPRSPATIAPRAERPADQAAEVRPDADVRDGAA